MSITPRTSTVYVAVAASVIALVLLTSTTLTGSVYATRHHSHRSIEDMPTNFGGYQSYGNNPVSDQGPQLAGQGYSPQLAGQGYSPQLAGQGYSPQLAGQGYSPKLAGQGYSPQLAGQGYSPQLAGQGYSPQLAGQGYSPQLAG